jgi:hypothetical protein
MGITADGSRRLLSDSHDTYWCRKTIPTGAHLLPRRKRGRFIPVALQYAPASGGLSFSPDDSAGNSFLLLKAGSGRQDVNI